MPFLSSARGAFGPQGKKSMRGPLAPVWVTSGTVANQNLNTSLSVQLSATDDSGVASTYTIASGSLPPGISLSSSGLLSGTLGGSAGTTNFTIRATDENGRFTDSSTLSIIGINPEVTTPGGRVWNSPGTYSFTVPAGVLQVSAVVIGAGGGGGFGTNNHGGGGGGLAYSTFSTTPGQTFTVVAGANGSRGDNTTAGTGGTSSISLGGTTYLQATGGQGASGSGTGCGGNGGSGSVSVGTGASYSGGFGAAGDQGDDGGGGGGAAGYGGNGGNAEAGTNPGQIQCYQSDSGRSGNGGTSGSGARGGYGDMAYGTDSFNSGGGGGTNLYGGAGQIGGGDQGGQPGWGGANSGGYAGGGGGGGFSGKACCQDGRGAPGGVRIIWGKVGGAYRTFPSTNVADSTSYSGTAESANTNG